MSRGMSRGRLVLDTIPVMAGLMVLGCAAGNKLMVDRAVDVDLAPYTRVLVKVDSSITERNVEKELGDLEVRIISLIKKTGEYRSVLLADATQPARPSSLTVQVRVTKLRRVSKTGRFLGGAFAGRATLVADVKILDGRTGNEIGVYTVTGQSGSSGYSGGTEDAAEKAAVAIADLVAKQKAPSQ
jgi:hypothetical protein